MKRCVSHFILLLFLFFSEIYASPISNYHATFIPLFTRDGHLKIALRHFQKDQQVFFLSVDPYDYKTEVFPVTALFSKSPEDLKNTPYIKSLLRYTTYPGTLENAGITHSENTGQGVFLTVDMCPSSHPFEREFYDRLVALSDKNHAPFPVAISVSGLWILHHKNEFQWLLDMQQAKKLNITWVNHSFSHVYFSDLPLSQNFLLFHATHLKDEILATEKILLQADQVPSVFFRLPGLVANAHVLQKLRKYGLIPVGADAWLAKNQKPTNGSIVLVHGNGNEHEGIVEAMPYLQDPNIQWLPLSKALPDNSL